MPVDELVRDSVVACVTDDVVMSMSDETSTGTAEVTSMTVVVLSGVLDDDDFTVDVVKSLMRDVRCIVSEDMLSVGEVDDAIDDSGTKVVKFATEADVEERTSLTEDVVCASPDCVAPAVV